MKSRAVIFCLALVALATRAYWADTPLEQLASNSDCVVIGRVTSVVADTNTFRLRVTMNELMPLKGSAGLGSSVTFDAPYTLSHCVTILMRPDEAQNLVRTIPNSIIREWGGNRVEVVSPNSFSTNETCAVFLKKTDKPGAFQLVQDDDGKFNFDGATLQLHKGVRTNPTNWIPFETFATVVKTLSVPRTGGVIFIGSPIAPTAPPAITFTNLPIQLILPRAITR